MNLNLTLLGQMITFAVFVWFTMKYVWPPMTKALTERQKKIAEGIAASEKSQRELELAERKVMEMLQQSRDAASQIIESANKRAEIIIEEAKEGARLDAQRILSHGQAQIEQAVIKAKEELRLELGNLVLMTTEKVLGRSMDAVLHQELINQAINEIQ